MLSPQETGQLAGALLALFFISRKLKRLRRRRPRKSKQSPHILHKKTARNTLTYLSKLDPKNDFPKIIATLRNLNPYAFEDLIIMAFEQHGYRTDRNPSYSNDGGIDGKVFYNGRSILIQDKRYKATINPKHIDEFADVCKMHKTTGIFVHTGRTGPKSTQAFQRNPQVALYSGMRLARFVTGANPASL